MPSRIAEVIYRLKDLFTGPAARVEGGYERIRKSSRRTAKSVEKDNKRISSSFSKLDGKVKAIVGSIGAGFVGDAVIGQINGLADELDRLGKTADRLSIDPSTLSAFEFAAERSGVATAKMVASIETLQKRTGEASKGLGIAVKAFEALNISVDEFQSLGAEEQMLLLADRVSRLASEEERAAVAAQLFSKQNLQMLQVLNQGADGLERLIKQGKEYRNVTREQVEAAAAYNDALADLSRQADALKFDKLTPIIEVLSRGLAVRGFGDPVNNLRIELKALEEQVERPWYERIFGFRGHQNVRTMQGRISRLKIELREYEKEQQKVAAAADEEVAAREAQAEAAELYKVELEDLTDAYKRQVAEQKKSLATQTAELKAARTEQTKIEKEFKALVEGIAEPDVGEVGLIDIFGRINQAAAAASQGQSAQAITLARQGAELLRKLKEKGSETDGTLRFLAERLQAIAVAAAGERTKVELIDVDEARGQLEGVKNALGALKADAVTEGQAVGKAFVAAMQAELAKARLTLPGTVAPGAGGGATITPATPAQKPTKVIRRGNYFGDTLPTELEKRGVK